jgi:iron complex transport system substrate-binding protein
MVVARSHECDYPPQAAAVPAVTSSLVDGALPSAIIDEALAAAPKNPHGIFEVDEPALEDASPDVVIVSSTCPECGGGEPASGACSMPAGARVVAINPRDLNAVLASVVDVATIAGMSAAGQALAAAHRSKLSWLASVVEGLTPQRTAVIEWAEPLYAPGNWTPDIIEAAGGISVFGAAGQNSQISNTDELSAARPEVVVLAFCGFDLHETQARFRELARDSAFVRATRFARTYAVDGSVCFSRPGPRVLASVELMAWILHRPDDRLRPPVGRGARLIEAGWVDVAALPVVVETPA